MSALGEAAARALRWPIFLAALAALYWSVALMGLSYNMRFLNFWGKRADVYGWAKGMTRLFRVRALRASPAQRLERGRVVYLLNHRSWADFLCDQLATEGRALFLSRAAVAAAFPVFMAGTAALRGVVFFRRGKRGAARDYAAFNAKIDAARAASPQPALAVYPEGTRSTSGASLPLRRGMLNYAHSRGLPCQAVVGANKEAVLAEKARTARLGQTIAVAYSPLVSPADYPAFDDFVAAVQAAWDAAWAQAFSADVRAGTDAAGAPLPELEPGPVDLDYPPAVRAVLAVIIPATIALFLGVLWASARAAAAAYAAAGAAAPALAAAAAAYVAASFAVYSRPVVALELRGAARGAAAAAAAAAAAGAPADGAGAKDK